ncbi:GntR family transcriptional regulator [Clostridium sp. D2Q-14]|uniref:GntR family transcriptional regulator n=1 Tax=Anaeromonas gelatinilytica TaxID=2683194 RepID=UPI00193B7477|nr:GntR family transcriptional regulator [Anaeromonas gelatinilytica]MBS4535764.1 GntR family transcriptional regulator [Anaeromonas gelatinilytica]
MTLLSKDNKIPLYYQLYDIIVNQIESRVYNEHDKLPSERELCDEYDISRATVRKAMNELEKKGYIYKKHGKGIFVSDHAFKQDLLEFYSFTEEMKKIGKEPSSEVIDFGIVDTTEKLSRKLNCHIESRLYKFTRIRLADNEPMMLETTYLPQERFPSLTNEELENKAMYDIFRDKYGVTFSKAEERFRPVITRKNEAELLDINKKIPSMMIERYTYEKDNIIEYTVGIARGDKFEFRVILKK